MSFASTSTTQGDHQADHLMSSAALIMLLLVSTPISRSARTFRCGAHTECAPCKEAHHIKATSLERFPMATWLLGGKAWGNPKRTLEGKGRSLRVHLQVAPSSSCAALLGSPKALRKLGHPSHRHRGDDFEIPQVRIVHVPHTRRRPLTTTPSPTHQG